MQKIDIKEHIESLYLNSLNFDNSVINSPVLAVDAVKSLIGINLDADSSKLIDWLESYLEPFQIKHEFKQKEYKEIPEVISYKKLEEALLIKDFDSIRENIYYLSRVSEGSQIFEYLLEYSFIHCVDIHDLIWSAYRMDRFLGKKYVLMNLDFCCQLILDNLQNYNNKENIEFDWKNILKYESSSIAKLLNFYAIFNSSLIRAESIRKSIINRILEPGFLKNDKLIKTDVLKEQVDKGRLWILDYLDSLEEAEINYDLIIFLNSGRAALMVADDDSEKNMIWKQLNSKICN